ncbi:hypothetical protein [Halomarina ordinaria]|uniref:Uncharacterized protein n=1 Tax=Halomarina ordinaria TaxID=3033939 RepID=A0ABD5UEI8_9EURY|nr:hypothetical protein [Halomarina sp. PSRA2]
MATDTVERRRAHLRGLTVTALTAIAGLAAGLGGSVVASGPQDVLSASVLLVAIAVQIPLLRATGVVDEFSAKDYLYVAFMTFSFWFVCLTVVYTAGVSL